MEWIMRLIEFASAEEQITLFKLITDKVWQSLADQQRQQAEQAAQQRRQSKMAGGVRPKRAAVSKTPAAKAPAATTPSKPPMVKAGTSAPPALTPVTQSAGSQALGTEASGTERELEDARIALYPQKRGDMPKPLR
ncbi:MAG: hypothetical protein EBZ03_12545 [Betaproteobacteria bacterium]|nr:hypothetical protein [Betaproteobacteria bacterium]NCV39854.1 hypothetical protein [Betaproteobacteria bacterium]NCV89997.1 hypothetical protein [Betaproteobacteria bacterium]NCW98308.1 hypothetical protein [Betaproteobacteria bacterium]NCX24158.1 hypothetical protein [Betaproteobacteria bacterium]